jgi:hypothetical protein
MKVNLKAFDGKVFEGSEILFRIPFTIYFLVWITECKLFGLARKEFGIEAINYSTTPEHLYYWVLV